MAVAGAWHLAGRDVRIGRIRCLICRQQKL
jgi:hypothetical protein